MSRKRDKIKGFFGVKSRSSSSALAPVPAPTAASRVGSSVPMLPTGTSKEPCESDPDADTSHQEQL
jgi:hypothetical protein